jgi:hypothetical protein
MSGTVTFKSLWNEVRRKSDSWTRMAMFDRPPAVWLQLSLCVQVSRFVITETVTKPTDTFTTLPETHPFLLTHIVLEGTGEAGY